MANARKEGKEVYYPFNRGYVMGLFEFLQSTSGNAPESMFVVWKFLRSGRAGDRGTCLPNYPRFPE